MPVVVENLASMIFWVYTPSLVRQYKYTPSATPLRMLSYVDDQKTIVIYMSLYATLFSSFSQI